MPNKPLPIRIPSGRTPLVTKPNIENFRLMGRRGMEYYEKAKLIYERKVK